MKELKAVHHRCQGINVNRYLIKSPQSHLTQLKVMFPETRVKSPKIYAEAAPGFFLGGGALISCSTSAPINHIVVVVVFFFAEYQLY